MKPGDFSKYASTKLAVDPGLIPTGLDYLKSAPFVPPIFGAIEAPAGKRLAGFGREMGYGLMGAVPGAAAGMLTSDGLASSAENAMAGVLSTGGSWLGRAQAVAKSRFERETAEAAAEAARAAEMAASKPMARLMAAAKKNPYLTAGGLGLGALGLGSYLGS